MIEFRPDGRQGMLLLLAIGVVFGLNAVCATTKAASHNTYYVAPNGDDDSPGTEEEPWETIQHGADIAGGGDTVYVRAGTYVETVTMSNSGTSDFPITMTAYPGESPIIDGNWALPSGAYPDAKWAALVKITGDYVDFDGFEVRNSRGRGVEIYRGQYCELRNLKVHHAWDIGILDEGEYSLVEDCEVYQNSYSNAPPYRWLADWSNGIVAVDTDHHTFRRNKVYNNHGEGMTILRAGRITLEDNVIYDNLTAQLYIDNGYDVLIQRNLIYSTDDRSFWWGEAPGPGLAISDEPYSHQREGRNRTIINNIIVGNGVNLQFSLYLEGSGLKGDLIANNSLVEAVGTGYSGSTGIQISRGAHSNTRFVNNIILQTEGSLADVVDDAELEFTHNLWSSAPPGSVSGVGDVVGDPALVDPDHLLTPGEVSPNWYKLRSSSPAIDEGIAVAEVTEDFFGDPRGDSPDIGAHECSPQ